MTTKISKYEHLIYFSVWVAVFIISFVIVGDEIVSGNHVFWVIVLNTLLETIPFLISFIIHAYLLIPYLLEKHRYVLYAVSISLMISLFTIDSYVLHTNRLAEQKRVVLLERLLPKNIISTRIPEKLPDRTPPRKKVPPPVVMDFSQLILLISANLLVRYTFVRQDRKKKMIALQQELTRAELDNLRSQLSPHFLMNVLNNIHGLIEIDQSRAQDMVLELSNMMRYVIYDCASNSTTISKEIDFIENYLKLMSARYPDDKLVVNLNLSNTLDFKNRQIPPLIFIVFIENAFKHGISYMQSGKPYININFDINDNILHFACTNLIKEQDQQSKKSGIGLNNIIRRLDVIYGDSYNLKFNSDAIEFCVDLKIPLEYENQMFSN